MTDSPTPRKFKFKGFTSLLLTFSLLVIGFTGVMLYFTPKGRVAHWTGWTMLGLDKDQWSAIHIVGGLLFLIVSGIHLYLNWGIFWSYLKKKAVAGIHLKWELVAAVLIVAVVVTGTLCEVPPLSSIIKLNDQIKVYWAGLAAKAPIPHAEDLTLEAFADEVRLSIDEVTSALRKEGFAVDNTNMKLKHIAERNGVAPSDLHAAIIEHFPQAAKKKRRGAGCGQRQN